jgi:superfamily II DNA helicase RecQ
MMQDLEDIFIDDDALEEAVYKLERIGLIERRVKQLFQADAKKGQVEALYHLLYDKKDLILIASTGFGKSTIFQSAPLMQDGLRQTALIIMPLKAIEQEQCKSLKNVACAAPFVLDMDTNKRENLLRIGAGEFTHSKNNSIDINIDSIKS